MAELDRLRHRFLPLEVGGTPVRALLSEERNHYLDDRFELFCAITREISSRDFNSPLDRRAMQVGEIVRREYRNHDWKMKRMPSVGQIRRAVSRDVKVSSGNTTCNENMREMVNIVGMGEKVRISPTDVKGDMRYGEYTTRHGKLALTAEGQVVDYQTGDTFVQLPREDLPDRIVTNPNALMVIASRLLLGEARQFRQLFTHEWRTNREDRRGWLSANFYQWPEWVMSHAVDMNIWTECLSRMVATYIIEPIYFVALSYDYGSHYAFPFFRRFYNDRLGAYPLSLDRRIDSVDDIRQLMHEWLGNHYRDEVSVMGNMMQMFRLSGEDVVQ